MKEILAEAPLTESHKKTNGNHTVLGHHVDTFEAVGLELAPFRFKRKVLTFKVCCGDVRRWLDLAFSCFTLSPGFLHCKHNTTRAHIPHFRTRELSRVAQDLSHQVSSECWCLDKITVFTSGTQCRTRIHCCSLT